MKDEIEVINGEEYIHESVSVVIDGNKIEGMTSIEYEPSGETCHPLADNINAQIEKITERFEGEGSLNAGDLVRALNLINMYIQDNR